MRRCVVTPLNSLAVSSSACHRHGARCGNPRLLILDEPTTGLDATVEAEVLDLIEELRSSVNAAILLITHNLGLIARLCERVGVLYAGRMVEEGLARQLFTEPRHPYTMGLLRCVPRFGMKKGEAACSRSPERSRALGEKMPGCVYAMRCVLAQPVCTRREPVCSDGLHSLRGGAERAQAEPEASALPSPHDAASVGDCKRHTRCYFPERVPDLPEAARPAPFTAAMAGGDLLASRTCLAPSAMGARISSP